MTDLTLSDIPDSVLRQSRHLHFSSVFLQPGIKNDIAELFKMAKQNGLTTSFDPQWDPEDQWSLDLQALLPYVDIFLPNEAELLKITRTESVEKAFEVLGPLEGVCVVKQGSKGSTVYHQGNILFQSSYFNHNVVDTIGAGDSFASGFIHEYLRNSPLEICQSTGNLMGAISTTAQGGTSAFENLEHVSNLAISKFGIQYEY